MAASSCDDGPNPIKPISLSQLSKLLPTRIRRALARAVLAGSVPSAVVLRSRFDLVDISSRRGRISAFPTSIMALSAPESQQEPVEEFEVLGESKSLLEAYWSDENRVEGVTDAACDATLPAGTIVFGYYNGRYQFRRVLHPMHVRVSERGASNYDNQRQAVLPTGDAFYLIAAGSRIPEGSDSKHDLVFDTQANVAEYTKNIVDDR